MNRTSPRGQPFLGTCAACGKTDITLAQSAREECPRADAMTDEQAIVLAVEDRP